MSNHKAEALTALMQGWDMRNDNTFMSEILYREAQVHATLELARQQQIANLIALGPGFIYQETKYPALDSVCPLLNPTVAADLGVTE